MNLASFFVELLLSRPSEFSWNCLGESERARVDLDDPFFFYQRLKDLRSDINRGVNRGFPPGWSKKGTTMLGL